MNIQKGWGNDKNHLIHNQIYPFFVFKISIQNPKNPLGGRNIWKNIESKQ